MSSGSRTSSKREYQKCKAVTTNYPLSGTGSSTSTETDYTSYTTLVNSRTWSGGELPNYRELIRKGEDVTNAYWSKTVRHTTSPGTLSYKRRLAQLWGTPAAMKVYRTIDGSSSWSVALSAASIPTSFNGQAESDAAAAFTRRFREVLSEAQAIVSGGEARESVHAVLHARDSVFRKLRAFQNTARAVSLRLRGNSLKHAVSEAYIEWSFGVRPLVADVESLANAAAKTVSKLSDKPFRFSANGSYSTDTNYSLNNSTQPAINASYSVQYDVAQHAETSVRWYGKVRIDAHTGTFASNFGLTLDNWVPSLYELIPYSWAVDYFTGIGDFISSVCLPLSKLQFYGRSRKTSVTRTLVNPRLITGLADASDGSRVTQVWITPPKASVESVYFVRDHPTYVVATPYLRVPGWASSYMNLGALAVLKNSNHLLR